MDLKKFFLNDNKNGKKTQEIYLKNNFPSLYGEIIDFNKGDLKEIPFKEKIWHYINNVNQVVLCYICNKPLKFKKSLNEGYGKYCSLSCTNKCDEHKEKVKETNIEKYGGQGSSSEIIRNKVKEKTKEKFGVENIFERKDIIKDSFLKKYGVETVSEIDGIREKINNTNLIKYGHKTNLLDPENIKKSLNKRKEFFIEKYKDLDVISHHGNDIEIKCEKCGEIYIIKRTVLYHRKNLNVELCTLCNPVTNSISYNEKEVFEFIKEILPNEDIIEKDRKFISPQEIDIIISNKKIGIEYNDLLSNSSYYLKDTYHLEKYKKCITNDYQLIQIFEDEWLEKRDIVKSIIKTNLNIFERKIYGRECVIKEIDNKTCKEFIDDNHIQGHSNSKIKIGLYNNDELVSVMTFGSLRKSLGMTNKEGSYEMVRFCNLKNTIILGGASKLFKYFIKTYNPLTIISFSDNRYFTGNLYKNLGFNFIGETKPNYFYLEGRKRINRFNYRKDVLVSKGYDPNKSEREITEEIGLLRIYDCGSKKWVYENPPI
jgi:hypothetical protein